MSNVDTTPDTFARAIEGGAGFLVLVNGAHIEVEEVEACGADYVRVRTVPGSMQSTPDDWSDTLEIPVASVLYFRWLAD